DMCELDERVCAVSRDWLPGLHAGAFDDPRLHLHVGDGRRFLETRAAAYDVVVMDMTDPGGPATAMYTREHIQTVQASLRDEHGLFVMHAEGPLARPRAQQQILSTVASVFPSQVCLDVYIPMYGTLWTLVIAGDALPPSCDLQALDAVLTRRGISGLQWYCGASHAAALAAPPWLQQLREESRQAPVVTDAQPNFEDEQVVTANEAWAARLRQTT
ncbi:MAG: spermidine synthase, partial [Planctomycetota bacterium]